MIVIKLFRRKKNTQLSIKDMSKEGKTKRKTKSMSSRDSTTTVGSANSSSNSGGEGNLSGSEMHVPAKKHHNNNHVDEPSLTAVVHQQQQIVQNRRNKKHTKETSANKQHVKLRKQRQHHNHNHQTVKAKDEAGLYIETVPPSSTNHMNHITSSSTPNIYPLDYKDDLFGSLDKTLASQCWSLRLDHKFKKKPKPFTRPRFKQTLSLVGTGYRCRKFLQKCKVKNVQSHIDFFSPLQCRQIYGVPMGALGTGTIGRSFTGDFTRYQLVPGIYEHNTVDANLFTVNIRKKATTVYQQVLSTRRSKQKGLRAWNMAYCGEHATYYALYPESWTVYNLPGQNVTMTCHQVSPMIPNNYKDSSLPVSLFNWTVENKNKEDIELSLMFTWQAGSASDKFELTDMSSFSFNDYNNYNQSMSGVVLNQKLRNMPLQYCIAARKSENCQVTYNCQFYTDNEESGTSVWMDLLKDGQLDNIEFNKERALKRDSSRLTVAVCVNVQIKAYATETIDLALVWYNPIMHFSGDDTKLYKRFYTRYFPETSSDSCMDIAAYALANQENWDDALKAWRRPILDNKKLPNFYKAALFNELYFLADGGTVWILADSEKHEVVREYGRFAYLEGHEYRMYNTYDVHFYASFALVQLWPKLHLSIQYDFAETISVEIKTPIKFLFKGNMGIMKTKHCLPHDVGDPEDKPWDHLNAYLLHDTKNWKDLNLKFILTVYRDFYMIKDMDYLRYMWPKIKQLMITVQSQDHDKDGLIDSEGLPDQTYDAWAVYGASAYCGGLHVATLKCVCEMAKLLGDELAYEKYSPILDLAKRSYDTKLWTGKYYKYDCSNSDYNDSIMADMCCGHWYLQCSGLGHQVFEREKIKSCLETIYEYNVIKYADGHRGAVNGMKPDGKVDITSIQSEEMWIGVTDALASLMIFEGMNEKAWKTLEGMYDLLFNKLGMAFQTPEALLKSNTYRSLGYMRPLCIWAVQYAINQVSS